MQTKTKVAAKHDFAAKLRQASLLPRVLDYVKWQRAVRAAQASGMPVPEMPPLSMVSMNLDPTTGCNYACPHCIDSDNLNKGINYVDKELFDSLDSLVVGGLRSVILIGGGEPTIHRRFEDIVRFLKERGVKLGVVTNGSRGDVLKRIAPVLTRGDWIRLSLDSGTNETFMRMHLPKNGGVNLETICAWVPRIRRANPAVQVGFSFIIVWEGSKRAEDVKVISNIDEIVAAGKLAKESGFTYISYKPFLNRLEDGEEVMDPSVTTDLKATLARITSAIDKVKLLETKDFKVLESTNLRVLMAGNWRDFTHQPKTCHMMAFRQVLSPLGLFHCPAKRGAKSARVGGNNALMNVHQDETRRSLQQMITTFDASHECRNVTCLYNAANWWLEDLISGKTDIAELTALPDRGDDFL